jgi:hypothetical protein
MKALRPMPKRVSMNFPMIGKIFSNGWKNAENFFQWLENRAVFSNDWKLFFQWLENFRAAVRPDGFRARMGA